MEAIFQVQQKFKREFGLNKVKALRNRNYKAHGTKSYVHALNKFLFTPTLEGPYTVINRVQQRGLAHPNFKAAVGGRVHMHRCVVKSPSSGSGTTPGGSGAPTGSDPSSSDPSSTQTGQVGATDVQGDAEYLCPVQIGTPAQTLNLDFDTGSSDLWVFSTELPSSTQQNHNVFNPKNSSTWKAASSETWQIQYGDGSTASGDVGTDNISIGGLVVKDQSVELAKTLSDQFASGTGDGLLGLAWPSINTIQTNGQSTPQPTPVANMISQTDIPKEAELFTSALYSDRDAEKSFYTFGFIDQDLVTASGQDIAYTAIDNSQGFWMFPSASYTVAGKKGTQSGNTAILDTGTTLCLVSDAVCKALYAAIPGAKYDSQQQGYTFPSSVTADQFPAFSIAIGDNEYTIQPEDLAFADAGNGTVYGGVQSRGENPFDILGDVMLKSLYVIWDQGNTRVGVVPKIEKTQNVTPSAASGTA